MIIICILMCAELNALRILIGKQCDSWFQVTLIVVNWLNQEPHSFVSLCKIEWVLPESILRVKANHHVPLCYLFDSKSKASNLRYISLLEETEIHRIQISQDQCPTYGKASVTESISDSVLDVCIWLFSVSQLSSDESFLLSLPDLAWPNDSGFYFWPSIGTLPCHLLFLILTW